MRAFAGVLAFLVIVLIGVAILINEWVLRRKKQADNNSETIV